MQKLYGLVMAALFVVGSMALAQQVQPKEGNPGTGTYNAPNTQPGTGGTYNEPSRQPRGAVQPEAKAMGEHEMTGTVSKIDHDKGLVSLRTASAPLQLHFPPQSIRGLKKGDKITAELAFWPSTGAESLRAGDVPARRHTARKHEGTEFGQHTMTGTVTNITRDKGMVSLNTDHGVLQLHFPSEAITSLKTGDRITVELAYYKAGTSEKTR